MPTQNPRIQLTLPPPRYDLLKRLAALQGVSMASLVSELLQEFYPVMERVCVVLEAAKQAQATSKQGLRDAVAQAEDELLPLARATLGQFDLFMDRTEGAVSTGTGQATDMGQMPPGSWPGQSPGATGEGNSERPRKGANPRVVTRGSGRVTPPPSNAGQDSRKARGRRDSGQ